MTEAQFNAWREAFCREPFVIEGDMAVWDDGVEQQGLYIKVGDEFQPLSTFLLNRVGLTSSDLWGEYQEVTLRGVRVTLTFEPLPPAED